MQRKTTGSHDSQIFARTAMRTKAINIYNAGPRGGYRG